LINGLKPYIEVIQIGENTTGKFQASTTLYDSPNFRRSGANLGHTYAVQPLIYKTLNANNVSDYVNGLEPDVEMSENIRNLGMLGDPQEPLLAAALAAISGENTAMSNSKLQVEVLGESEMYDPLYQKMYAEDVLPQLTFPLTN
jgi:C-terminal processing protease CtpA/Prc